MKITVSKLRKMKQEGQRIVMLTAYDAPTARLAEECGIDLLLVGDSLGMCVLGYQNTLSVTLEESLHHCKAVRRGAPESFIIGDMPFMTMHASERDALLNAARYLQEGGCDAVKIEGDSALLYPEEDHGMAEVRSVLYEYPSLLALLHIVRRLDTDVSKEIIIGCVAVGMHDFYESRPVVVETLVHLGSRFGGCDWGSVLILDHYSVKL